MPPTSYSIKESLKAKCVRIKVSLYDARVVVVVPCGFDREQIPDIVREKQSWIERVQKQVNEQRALVGTDGEEALPEQVYFRALDEAWRLEYERAEGLGITARERPGRRLLLRGAVEDYHLCRQVLQQWVRHTARARLVPWLEAAAREQALPISRIVVRAQRSRWGSCSRQRTISINQKLLFVPPSLVRYVFLHELCHTLHFDHSRAFWEAMRRREPRCRALDQELNTAWRYVPVWMYVPEGQGVGSRA